MTRKPTQNAILVDYRYNRRSVVKEGLAHEVIFDWHASGHKLAMIGLLEGETHEEAIERFRPSKRS